MRRKTWMLAGVMMIALIGACTQPIEPGSDLDDPAPMAELGEREQFELNGVFEVNATAEDPAGGDPIPLVYLIKWVKTGNTISSELLNPMDPTAPGLMAAETSEPSQTNQFTAEFPNIPLPDDPDATFEEADLLIEATLRADNCVSGDVVFSITKPFAFDLTGPFQAEAQGSEGACGTGGAQ